MIFSLTARQEEKLLSIPETEMGFQVVTAEPCGVRRSMEFLVLNAEIAIDIDQHLPEFKSLIVESGIQRLARTANEWKVSSSSIQLVSQTTVRDRVLIAETKGFRNTLIEGGAVDNEIEQAAGDEVFARLSPYKKDKRIDFENRCLLPGSYSTTLKDYLTCIHIHDDPIERYALPTDDKIEWAFFIQPVEGDELRRGVVQPKFDRRGGGEEVYFDHGTSMNTLLSIRTYGDEP